MSSSCHFLKRVVAEMQPPFAGRRKGMTAAAPTPLSGPAVTDSGPSWLFGDDPPSAVAPTPAAAVVPSDDPLSFLNFDPPAVPPARTSQQPQDAVPAAPQGPAFLLGDDTRQSSQPIGRPPATHTLAFLDDDYTTPAPAAAESPPVAGYVPPLNSHKEPWLALVREFFSLSTALEASQLTISSFSDGTHEVCREVAGLQTELDALQKKQTEALLVGEAAAREASHEAGEVSAGFQQADEVELEGFRLETERVYKDRLVQAQANTSKQEKLLLEAETAVAEMRTNLAEPPHVAATRDLELRMATFLRNMRSDFALQVKPLLSNSIRENMTTASTQRNEIFHTDRQKRLETLRNFRMKRSKDFESFQDSNRRRMAEKRDLAFGELLQRFEAERHQRVATSEQRLAASRAAAEASMLDARHSFEESIKHVGERVSQQTEELQRRCREEEASLRKRRQADLRSYQERTDSEKNILLRNHRTMAASQWEKSESAPGVYEAVQGAASSIQAQLDQIRMMTQTDHNILRTEGSRSTATARNRDAACAEKKVQAFQDNLSRSVQELNTILLRLRSTAAAADQTVDSFNETFRERRVRLNVLHNSVDAARRAWEGDIRRQLHYLGTSSDSDIPYSQDLVREVVHGIQSRVDNLGQKQLHLRHIRQLFTEHVAQQMSQLTTHHNSNDTALTKVFDAYERLRQVSTMLESRKCLLETTEQELLSAEAELAKERGYVTQRQSHVEQAASVLREESQLLHRAEKKLRKLPQASSLTIARPATSNCRAVATSSGRGRSSGGVVHMTKSQWIAVENARGGWPYISTDDGTAVPRPFPSPHIPASTGLASVTEQQAVSPTDASGDHSHCEEPYSSEMEFCNSLIPVDSDDRQRLNGDTPDPAAPAVEEEPRTHAQRFAPPDALPVEGTTILLSRSLTTPSTLSQ